MRLGRELWDKAPGRMEHIQHIIHHYRGWIYLITVAFTFFEGETFVLLAAAAAAGGALDPVKLGACAWLGSCLGDQCWFFIGRLAGPLVLRRFPRWKHGIDAVHRWLERWDTVFILSFRFLYGIRNFSSIALGLSDVGVSRFLVLNFIAAGLWSVSFITAGLFFGRTLGRLLTDWAETVEMIAAGVFVGVVVIVVLIARWRSRRARRIALLPADRP